LPNFDEIPVKVLEKAKIIELRTCVFDDNFCGFGCNFTFGGEGACGFKHSEFAKQKMHELFLGRSPWNKGKKCESRSPDVRKKISESSKGRIISDETRRKMSKAHLGKKHLTNESREKISLANRGRKITEEHKERLSEANASFWTDEKRKEHSAKMKVVLSTRSIHLGKKRSEETRQKMRLAQQKRRESERLNKDECLTGEK